MPAPALKPWLSAKADETVTRRSGDGTGSVRSNKASTMLNIAVFAPMPSASDTTAAAETIGEARSARTACRKSCMAPPATRERTLAQVAIPAYERKHRPEHRDHQQEAAVQSIRSRRVHVISSFVF